MQNLLWSVIIPTAGRAKYLGNAIESLCKQSINPKNYEIIIVNNGQNDKDSDYIVNEMGSKFPKHQLKLLHATPPGLLSGRHLGAKEAKAKILTFVDDDIIASENYAENIIKSFENKNIHLVGGPSLPKFEIDPPKWLDQFWVYEKGTKRLPWLSLLDFGEEDKEILPEYIWGLNFSIRKKTLFEMGGFQPDNVPEEYQAFQGNGESGLAENILRQGLKAWYNHNVMVHHVIPASRLNEEYLKKRFFYQGVCESYSAIRKEGKCVTNLPLPLVATDDPDDLQKRLYNAYVDGWFFHQMAVKKSVKLLQWVLKEDYWDYQYPELEENYNFQREWSKFLLKNPMDTLNDPVLVLQMAMNFGKSGRIPEGIKAVASVERKYPTLVEAKNVRSFLLKIAGRNDVVENSTC